jgi:hypothetical protein
MCHTCTFEAFLELETGLTTFTMETFDLLMFGLPTGKSAMQYRVTAANNRADCVMQWSILRTEPMSIVRKGNLTIVDSAAWMSNSNAINHNDIDHVRYLPIRPMVKAYAFVAIMPYLGLTVQPETDIACLDRRCEPVLLCSGMRDLKRLLTFMGVFEQGENHEAIPDVIGLQFEPKRPVRWWGIVL